MKMAEIKDLDDAVFKWFLQQRPVGNPLSGPIACDKAKMFAEKWKACPSLRQAVVGYVILRLDMAFESSIYAAKNFLPIKMQLNIFWKSLKLLHTVTIQNSSKMLTKLGLYERHFLVPLWLQKRKLKRLAIK